MKWMLLESFVCVVIAPPDRFMCVSTGMKAWWSHTQYINIAEVVVVLVRIVSCAKVEGAARAPFFCSHLLHKFRANQPRRIVYESLMLQLWNVCVYVCSVLSTHKYNILKAERSARASSTSARREKKTQKNSRKSCISSVTVCAVVAATILLLFARLAAASFLSFHLFLAFFFFYSPFFVVFLSLCHFPFAISNMPHPVSQSHTAPRHDTAYNCRVHR